MKVKELDKNYYENEIKLDGKYPVLRNFTEKNIQTTYIMIVINLMKRQLFPRDRIFIPSLVTFRRNFVHYTWDLHSVNHTFFM